MIELKEIKKDYGNLKILKGIDLFVKKGECISIVGSSGAGKSTLLQIIGTLDLASQGKLLIDNVDIDTFLSKISKNIIGAGMPFVKQNKPGPISNDIVNNIFKKML